MTPVATVLAALEEAQILRRVNAPVDEELGGHYRFKHTLTQEAAYRSLPRRQRQLVHRRVAQCCETLFVDRLDEQAAVLAYHYGEAGDQEKLLTFSQRAGDVALRVYATAEAAAHIERAIGAAMASPRPSAEQLIHLYRQRGRALELASRHDAALANYEEMERQAQTLGFRDMELAAVVSQAQQRSTATPLFDREAGQRLIARAFALAHELGDRVTEARILWVRCNQNRLSGHQGQALKDGEASLAIARALGLREQAAYALNDISYILQLKGDVVRMLEANAEASAYWREVGNLPMLADSLAASLWSRYATGNFRQVLDASDEAHAISVRIGNVWGQSFSRMLVGLVHLEMGNLDRALADMDESLEKAEEAGFTVPRFATTPQKALVLTLLGDNAGARAVLQPILAADSHDRLGTASFVHVAWLEMLLIEGRIEEARDLMANVNVDALSEDNLGFRTLGVQTLVRFYLANGDPQGALDTLDANLPVVQQQGLRASLPDAGFLRAHALQALGQDGAARRSLEEARAVAVELGSRRILWEILAFLAELTADADAAARLWQEAAEVVAYLADHAPTPQLRASFLARPPVQRIRAMAAAGGDSR